MYVHWDFQINTEIYIYVVLVYWYIIPICSSINIYMYLYVISVFATDKELPFINAYFVPGRTHLMLTNALSNGPLCFR